MIRCIIVDDEKPAREELSFLINAQDGFQVMALYESGQKYLSEHPETDVVFLDINMPGLTGIEVAEILVHMEHAPIIVFVTAYDEFALKAFEVNAIDYILKPVSDTRIAKTLEKIKDLVEGKDNTAVKKLFNQFKRPEALDHICLHHDGKIIPVKLDEIIYVRTENKGVMIQATKGCYFTSHKLKDIEDMIEGSTLMRCHRSFIINTAFIEHIEPWFNRTYNVLLTNIDEKIPISRHYITAFNQMMHIF